MSFPESPATTDIERLIAAQEETQRVLGQVTEALNGLGQNVQWLIDNAKGIFQMFADPGFMTMMPQLLGGPQNAGTNEPGTAGTGEPGTG